MFNPLYGPGPRRLKYILLWLCAAFLVHACKPLKVQKTETQHTVMGDLATDSATYNFISPYKQKLDAAMSEVIGQAPEALVKQQPESNLGNFFSDIMLLKAQSLSQHDTSTLLALFNYGGLRTSIPQGDVRVGNIYEVMPFENQLVLVPIKGSELLTVLNALAEKGGAPVAGVRFEIAGKKAEQVFVRQIPLDTTKMYTVVTSDYLANGGDKFFTIDAPKSFSNTHVLLRDILIEYCRKLSKENKPITAKTDGRISIAK